MEQLDVVVVGAGISGIDAGYHLQTSCPWASYAILEARDSIGGTWDLFRYPGIRSDSDMLTLGFPFRPWPGSKLLADGPSILAYVRETASVFGIDKHIRFGHEVVSAEWSTEKARWRIQARTKTGETRELLCSFLYMCSGYYDYAAGYTPELPGRERYRGRIVHPQQWTPDIDYAGKRVIVIGSGATAVTLVPELAKQAAHVTMLQRSPTYIMSIPAIDPLAKWLPRSAARWKNIGLAMAFYQWCRRYPERAKKWIVEQVRKQLPEGYDLTHFTPRYKPWDQRLCFVPDSDLFNAIKEGRAEVVTDTIETFTERGVRLSSGKELEADLVVTATGLRLKFLGGMSVTVDGKPVDAPSLLVYKGMMLSGVPNLAFAVGYTNASWTLKCDLTSRYVCRLLDHMHRKSKRVCVPHRDPAVEELPLIDFNSGYVTRALADLPKQGKTVPWRLYQNYALDLVTLQHGRVDDPAMRFR
ncbi:MAG TPA: NAD(P)/FAD-dependent oxidoreductase [Kofleriaceae bacterium]|nr:NAD(P)/FAD-dependent oxidoreductase [Kofleriaceae bacterium]